MTQRAVLLANLGSPNNPDTSSVRKYLNQFLMDPYVIQLPWLLRRLIVSLFVLPSRPKASAHAYQSIWTEQGSPLLTFSQDLLDAVSQQTKTPVRMAMRYGNPDFESQILAFAKEGIEELLLIPLYPHYAQSTVSTSIEEAKRIIRKHSLTLTLDTFPVFYNHPGYIRALTRSAEPWLNQSFDHILFSYHGLPELHITKADPTNSHCLKQADCCHTPSPAHETCYRHQVMETTRLFVQASKLNPDQYSVSFQSRLGRAKWLDPSTSQRVAELANKGVKNLLVICPAFVTDCLETLEEIEMQAADTFKQSGGDTLTLIPCMNAHSAWVETLSTWCSNFATEP